MTKGNIEELEEACRNQGVDPGLHAHMTEEEVLERFKQLAAEESDMESEEEIYTEDL